jgi:hypothetical protein
MGTRHLHCDSRLSRRRGVLLVAALAPDAFRPFSLDERARFVFYAFALWALALVLIVVLSSHAAIEAHRHPNFG